MRARLAVSFLLVVGVLLAVLLTVPSLRDETAVQRHQTPSAPPPLRTERAEDPVRPPHLVGSSTAREPGIETAQASRGRIGGIVLDADGVPRAGAVVILRHPDAGTRTVGTRRTAGAGRFAFEDLEPGTYVVEVLAAPGLLGDASKVPVGERGARAIRGRTSCSPRRDGWTTCAGWPLTRTAAPTSRVCPRGSGTSSGPSCRR